MNVSAQHVCSDQTQLPLESPMSQPLEHPSLAERDDRLPQFFQQTLQEEEIPTQPMPRLRSAEEMPTERMPQQPQEMLLQPSEPVPDHGQAKAKRFGWLAVGLTAGFGLVLGTALGALGDRTTTAKPALALTPAATAMATVTATATATVTATVTQQASESPAASPSQDARLEPTEPTKPKTAEAARVTKRQWAKVVENPDHYSGERYVIYGQVTQFDTATSPDTFRADTAHTDTRVDGYFAGANTILTGDEEDLAGLVQGAVFKASVTVVGSLNYDTQIGAKTIVPYLTINNLRIVDNGR
jgi:hypothetical protein